MQALRIILSKELYCGCRSKSCLMRSRRDLLRGPRSASLWLTTQCQASPGLAKRGAARSQQDTTQVGSPFLMEVLITCKSTSEIALAVGIGY